MRSQKIFFCIFTKNRNETLNQFVITIQSVYSLCFTSYNHFGPNVKLDTSDGICDSASTHVHVTIAFVATLIYHFTWVFYLKYFFQFEGELKNEDQSEIVIFAIFYFQSHNLK